MDIHQDPGKIGKRLDWERGRRLYQENDGGWKDEKMKKELELIFTSDIHGHVFPVNYPENKEEASGLLNMGGQIKKTDHTLILDGGDSLQGTPLSQYYIAHSGKYSSHPLGEAFNSLGCDYYTLGNHDFNFGYEVLKSYIDSMKGQCLCANLEDLRGELKVKKHLVHVLGNGLRVGITGIVTDYVMIWEQPRNLEELRVMDAFETAKQEYEALKDQCDVTVCIYHGGFEEDLVTGKRLSDTRENVACEIAEKLGFDILLTGHQHILVEGVKLSGTYALQPPANGTHYMQLEALVEMPEGEELSEEGESKKTEATLKETGTLKRQEPEILRITSRAVKVGDWHKEEPYHSLLPLERDTQRWLDEPVGCLKEEILPEEKLAAALYGSRLADLFNAVQLEHTGADFSCTSLGNQPAGLKRQVSMREICGAYLFANTLVVLEVDEQAVRTALERCGAYITIKNGKPEISEEFLKPKVEHYNFDFYAGLVYEFDFTRPVGQRLIKLTLPDGSPLGDRKYQLVTNNYRATGTGGYEALAACPVIWRGALEMPELVAQYIRRHTREEEL